MAEGVGFVRELSHNLPFPLGTKFSQNYILIDDFISLRFRPGEVILNISNILRFVLTFTFLEEINGTIPSALLPSFENLSWGRTFHIKIRLIFINKTRE